ncbi:hypothetical protein HRbin34_00266 [bacterium HR34]|nr:hypothetical protein HRbin34_00266 [bacterium HR34]
MKKITDVKIKKEVEKKLYEVYDPEIRISLMDLGLIYKIDVKNGKVKITMTLTTIGCPLFELIEREIKSAISQIKGVKEVELKLTFKPPWTKDRLSQKAKEMLGII